MTTTARVGVCADVPIGEYHSDKSTLSASGAKKLLEPGGPAKFHWARNNPPEHKDHFDFGKVVHTLILGDGEQIVEVEARDWKSNAAKAARDQARAEGKVPVLGADLEKAQEMASAAYRHEMAAKLFADGNPETSLYAVDPETGVGLRARPDWITQHEGRVTIVDLKTAADANPDTFGRTAFQWSYHLQFAWYVHVARLLELDANPAFLFVCQEKVPPYLVSVNELDAEAFLLGRKHMRQAIAIYRECCETGVWPGYPPEINSLSLPPWAFTSNQPTIGELLKLEA